MRRIRVSHLAFPLALAGCAQIFGIEEGEFEDEIASGPATSTSTSGSAATTGEGAGGAGATGAGGGGGAGAEGGGPPTHECALLRPLQGFASTPSAVGVVFTVEDCETGEPIWGLHADDFVVAEDGEPIADGAARDLLDRRGVRFFTELVLDVSDSTSDARTQIIAGAKRFVDAILVEHELFDRAKVGISAFDGGPDVVRLAAPTSNAAGLGVVLDQLVDYESNVGASANLHGAVRQSVEGLQVALRSLAERNASGATATGHVVVFTDGPDTAGREPAALATQAIADARVLDDAGPSGVVQTWAVTLQGGGYDATALQNLLGGARWIFETESAAGLADSLADMGDRIGESVEATYHITYCSAARAGEHAASVTVSADAVPASEGFDATFIADDFVDGCNSDELDAVCDGRQCGGFGCGACDDEESECDGDTLSCRSYCEDAPSLCAVTFTNARGYSQECGDREQHTECDDECVDLASDGNHCGECGVQSSLCENGTPVRIIALGMGPASHNCAISEDYALYCWGQSGEGQLGDATQSVPGRPFRVPGAPEVDTAALGNHHTCARSTAGSGVLCWGNNEYGALGDGTLESRSSPELVLDLDSLQQVVAGAYHTCVVTQDGPVLCWGAGSSGQIGDGGTTERVSTPTAVNDLDDAIEVAGGLSHTCALHSGGTVSCWGANWGGQVGDGTLTDRTEPAQVAGLASVSHIAVGLNFSCALLDGGTVKCWGDNTEGVLGDGTTTDRSSPVDVDGLDDVEQLSCGYAFCCAKLVDDSAVCWGLNSEGQLGDGTTSSRGQPEPVTGLTNVVGVTAGFRHACALVADGNAHCWGSNYNGQIGDGTTNDRALPVLVGGIAIDATSGEGGAGGSQGGPGGASAGDGGGGGI